jgi:hypothetical protein
MLVFTHQSSYADETVDNVLTGSSSSPKDEKIRFRRIGCRGHDDVRCEGWQVFVISGSSLLSSMLYTCPGGIAAA